MLHEGLLFILALPERISIANFYELLVSPVKSFNAFMHKKSVGETNPSLRMEWFQCMDQDFVSG
jgi:hypothetical protein